MEGFGWIMDTPRIRLALHRHDLTTVNRLISAPTSFKWKRAAWYFPAAVATHLDALAALGEAERFEADANEFLEGESVIQAFAMRALGILRGDRLLLEAAASRFEAFGFESQAGNTRAAI